MDNTNAIYGTNINTVNIDGWCLQAHEVTRGIFNDKFTTYYTVDWRIL